MRTKGVLLIIMAGLLVSGCASRGVIKYDFKYISFKKNEINYEIDLASDVDIIHSLSKNGGLVGVDLVCSLSEDTNLALEYFLPYSMIGPVPKDCHPARNETGEYRYSLAVQFIQTSSDGSTERPVSTEQVKSLLSNDNPVVCKIIG